jgi:arylsulfatase A-like enzyme
MRRLQWDFPNIVRERDRTDEDVGRLALSAETHYRASIHLLDRLFGRLVESIRAAGLLEDSLIAFTADHGETLFRDHQLFKWTHGLQLSPDVIQVPLIVRLPARRGVERYTGVSRSIDVFPTLLGLAGQPVPEGKGIAGADLSAAVLGREPPPTLRAFSHTMPLTPELLAEFDGWLVSRVHPSTDVGLVWTGVRAADTYVRLRRSENEQWVTEAFDLEDDPAAERDLYDPTNRAHRELVRELEAYKRRLVDRHSEHEHEQSLHEEEVKERLRALGYIQ